MVSALWESGLLERMDASVEEPAGSDF